MTPRRQVTSTLLAVFSLLTGVVGALGITVVWVVTWATFFGDGRGFWGLASLVLTPLFTFVTAWWVNTTMGLVAVACLVLMSPSIALEAINYRNQQRVEEARLKLLMRERSE